MAGSEGGSGHRDSGDLERHYVAQRGELTAPSRYCIGCHGGRQDRLLRRRPRDDFPDRVNDGTVSTEVNAALQTDLIARDHPCLIFNRSGAYEDVPGVNAGRRPTGRDQKRRSTLAGEFPKLLRKTQVVAGRQPRRTQRCVHHDKFRAGRHQIGFPAVTKHVDLAIDRLQ